MYLMESNKHDELMMALESFEEVFSVSDTRDKMLSASKSFSMDSATLRRWIYSKFITLERQGLIVEIHNDASKSKQYCLSSQTSLQRNNVSETLDKALFKQLKARAAEYRLQLNIQMGQVDEYAQLRKQMPDLKGQLSKKERELADQNSQLLGRLKAVESLLADKASLR